MANYQELGTAANKGLQEFLTELVTRYQPDTIIRFGCIHDQHQACGCFIQPSINLTTHHFLLMVIPGTNRMLHEAQDFANAHFHHGTITLLVHSREAVTEAIKAGKQFFINVYRTGVVLYKSDGLFTDMPELPEVKASAILEEMERVHKKRAAMAKGFIRAAADCHRNGFYGNSVFILHQAVEQSCIMLIRVFMGYRVEIHHLGRLIDQCKCFSSRPSGMFARNTDNDKRLFKLLLSSYSDARYNSRFEVSKEDAETLLTQITGFVTLSAAMVKHRIEVFKASQSSEEPRTDFMPALPASIN